MGSAEETNIMEKRNGKRKKNKSGGNAEGQLDSVRPEAIRRPECEETNYNEKDYKKKQKATEISNLTNKKSAIEKEINRIKRESFQKTIEDRRGVVADVIDATSKSEKEADKNDLLEYKQRMQCKLECANCPIDKVAECYIALATNDKLAQIKELDSQIELASGKL